jgi:3-phosphoglycerate kinase
MEDLKIDEMFDLEMKTGEQVKKQIEALKKTLSKELSDIVWTACNDYVEYADWEPLNNWRSRARDELLGDDYQTSPDFWGKKMRAKIYEENKAELIPLIQNERIAALEKEAAELREALARERRWAAERRY